jgi:hypothetical protein
MSLRATREYRRPPWRADRTPLEPLAFDGQPLGEGRLAQIKTFQQVPAVQRDRQGARGRGRLGEVPLKHVDIHLDGFEIEGDGVAADQDDRFVGGGQRVAERGKRLSEVLAGLGLRRVAPQEGCEPSRSQAARGASARYESSAMAFFGASRGDPEERQPSTSPRSLRRSPPMVRTPGVL